MTDRLLITSFVGLFALALSACGGSNPASPPVPSPTPTPTPAPSPLPTFTFTGVSQNQAVFTDVTVTAPSVLSAVADWTSASDDIDIVYTDTSCNRTDARTIVLGFCNVQARTNSFTAQAGAPDRQRPSRDRARLRPELRPRDRVGNAPAHAPAAVA